MRLVVITPRIDRDRLPDRTLHSVRLIAGAEHLLADLRCDATQRHEAAHPDRAVALNRALASTDADVFTVLDAGDRLQPQAWDVARRGFESDPEVDVIYGDCVCVDASGRATNLRKALPFDAATLVYHGNYIRGPGLFYRRRIVGRIGSFDESLCWFVDDEYVLRAAKRRLRFEMVPRVLAEARMQGIQVPCPGRNAERQRLLAEYARPKARHPQALRLLGRVYRAKLALLGWRRSLRLS